MTDKQIIIDYKNLCDYYSREVGCYATFDGRCTKEQCSTYKLLQKLQAKEQECERLKEILKDKTDEYNNLAVNYDAYVSMANKQLDQLKAELEQEKALKDTYFACYHAKHEDLAKKYDQLKVENDELKKIINEAKNSKLDLKSFLVGEAVQNEYEQQLDQLKAENEELEEQLKNELDWHKTADEISKANSEYTIKLKQTLTEIKEYCTDMKKDHYWGMRMMRFANEILQKISEVEDDRL